MGNSVLGHDTVNVVITLEKKGLHEIGIEIQRGCSQPTIELSTGSPMEELEKGPKELKGFCSPIGGATIGTNRYPLPPELPWTKPPTIGSLLL